MAALAALAARAGGPGGLLAASLAALVASGGPLCRPVAAKLGGKFRLGGKAAKLAAKWWQSGGMAAKLATCGGFISVIQLMPGIQFSFSQSVSSVQLMPGIQFSSSQFSSVDARQTEVARLAAKRRHLAAKSVMAAKRHGGKVAAKLGGKVRHDGKASWRQSGSKA
eukprot:gene12733-biopygen1385